MECHNSGSASAFRFLDEALNCLRDDGGEYSKMRRRISGGKLSSDGTEERLPLGFESSIIGRRIEQINGRHK